MLKMKNESKISEKISLIKYFFCGGFGGVCTVLVGHPIDTIKVRLQTMPLPKKGESPLYNGSIDCFRKIVTNEGIRGLYKGMAAPLVVVAPIFAISFFSFGLGKRLINNEETQPLSMYELFAAGAFSGIFTSFIWAPGDRIKSLMQVQSMANMPQKYRSSFHCAKHLYATGGIRLIYKGTIATLLRDVPASGMFYMTYEVMKESMMFETGSSSRKAVVTIIAGGLAGVANWILALPFDVLKSRLQTAPEGKYPNGIRDVYKELMAQEGPAGFYRGMAPLILRAFIANAACYAGFELAANNLEETFFYI